MLVRDLSNPRRWSLVTVGEECDGQSLSSITCSLWDGRWNGKHKFPGNLNTCNPYTKEELNKRLSEAASKLDFVEFKRLEGLGADRKTITAETLAKLEAEQRAAEQRAAEQQAQYERDHPQGCCVIA